MNRCVILTALPGSGKSTYVKKLLAEALAKYNNPNQCFIYSTDQFIEGRARYLGKTYNDVFTDTIKEATASMDLMLRDAVNGNVALIICDQTNLTAKKRKSLMQKIGKKYTFESYCIVPAQTVDDAHELARRLQARLGKIIPDHIQLSMLGSYEEPELSEGFSKVTLVDIHGNVLKEKV